MHAGGNEDYGSVVDGKLFVSRCDASPLLEPVDAAFDDISLAIALFIEGNRA